MITFKNLKIARCRAHRAVLAIASFPDGANRRLPLPSAAIELQPPPAWLLADDARPPPPAELPEAASVRRPGRPAPLRGRPAGWDWSGKRPARPGLARTSHPPPPPAARRGGRPV